MRPMQFVELVATPSAFLGVGTFRVRSGRIALSRYLVRLLIPFYSSCTRPVGVSAPPHHPSTAPCFGSHAERFSRRGLVRRNRNVPTVSPGEPVATKTTRIIPGRTPAT